MKQALFISTFVAFSSLFSQSAQARELHFKTVHQKADLKEMDTVDLKYFTIESVEVKELKDSVDSGKNLVKPIEPILPSGPSVPGTSLPPIGGGGGLQTLGSVIASVQDLLALGTAIWNIIEGGKPVATFRFTKPISVIPNAKKDSNDVFRGMENWSAPVIKKYNVVYKNGWGSKVVSFDYIVHYQHSGSYEKSGEYLTGLTVTARNVSVSWGFKFNATSSLVSISNRRSADNPLAGATIQVEFKSNSVLSNVSSSELFHVTGDGNIIKYE